MKLLVDYERIEQEVREVRETLVKRWQTNVGTAEHALLTNRLRNSIPQAEKAVGNLLARIDDWELRNLTEREKERRIRLCETLQSSIKRVAMDFNDGRSSGATAHTSDFGWGVEEESVNTEGLTVEQIRERNRLVEQQQEAGLDVLSQVISRQKRIASAIGTEVDDQNDLLDEISERTTNTQNRLIDETDHIGIVQKKIRTWPYWLVIILLFIAIVIVAVCWMSCCIPLHFIDNAKPFTNSEYRLLDSVSPAMLLWLAPMTVVIATPDFTNKSIM